MRVNHVKLILAAAAITHAMKAKTTTSVAESTTTSSTESSSTGDRDDERMFNPIDLFMKAKTPEIEAKTPEIEAKTSEMKVELTKMNAIKDLRLENVPDELKDVPLVASYLKMIAANPEYLATAITSWKKNLSDKILAQLILLAKTDNSLIETAVKLEEAQMTYWLNNEKDAVHLFWKLGLTESKGDLLARPLFHYWKTYMDKANAVSHGTIPTTVFKTLARFYPDKDLAKIIEAAKMDKATKIDAVELGEEQLINWVEKKYSAEKLFEMLKLDQVKDDLFTHPLYNVWSTYLDKFSVEHPKEKISVAKSLPDLFRKDDLEHLLDDALTKNNLKDKSEVDDLCIRLGLDRVEDGLFTNRIFKFWRDCLEKFNEANAKKSKKTSVVQSLTNVYGDKFVEKMIQSMAKRTDSAEYAESLQGPQLTGWLNNGRSLGDVFGYLGLDEKNYEILVEGNPLMDRFITFANMYIPHKESMVNDILSRQEKEVKKDMLGREKWVTKEMLRKEKWVNLGIDLASNMGGLRATKMEKTFFQMWFTQEKNPYEIYTKQFSTRWDKNLFEIPFFVTFLKYADAFPQTAFARRPPLPHELAETNPEKTTVVWDPETEESYVEIKVDVASMISRQEGAVELGNMILLAKTSSESAQYAARRVEEDLFGLWSSRPAILPDHVWSWLNLYAMKTPVELFKNPMFRWWMNFMDFFLTTPHAKIKPREALMKMFESEENIVWLKEKRKGEFAQVWTELLNQHILKMTLPKSKNAIKGLDEILYLSIKIPEDKEILDGYKKAYDARKESLDRESFWENEIERKQQEIEKKQQEIERESNKIV